MIECQSCLGTDDYAAQWHAWQSGVSYEIAFWSRWLSASGGQYRRDFEDRLNPVLPTDAYLDHLISTLSCPIVRILDVGAGPLCCLGKVSPSAELELTAIDPLADFYDGLLEVNHIVPLVRTQFGMGEDLTLQFAEGSFDIVHMRNALDHSLDPLRAIWQMLHVCRLDGYVMLRHNHNEAEHEDYSGFHKWNLTNDGSSLVLWTKDNSIDVTSALAAVAANEMLRTKGYLINALRKKSAVPRCVFSNESSRWLNFQRAAVLRAGGDAWRVQ
jgi:SAM-dependent methyltransferase